MMRAIKHAALDQKLTPFIIGVTGEQGIVKVKQDKAHKAI